MALLLCVMPILQPMILKAEGTEKYPYTLFAASDKEGAITANASNFCVNGSVATNGTIIASGNFNVNGIKSEHAGEKMIYISGKIETKYFAGGNVDKITEDYVLEETNINISEATEVYGEVSLVGNININNAFMATGDIVLDGDVKNSNNSVIYSKYGDIIIDSQNVNLNGLVYAPFGDVVVTGQNLNLNSVIIIANKITFNCPNVNANTSNEMAKFIGTSSEQFNIPYVEWEYLNDSDSDGIPDLINDFGNWQYFIDTDEDLLPDCIEEYLKTDINLQDTDGDGLTDGYEFFIVGTDYLIYDSLGEGKSDGEYDLDDDGLSNIVEYEFGTHPWESDSDGDTLVDGEEVNIHGTDPLKSDSDGEGLKDGEEIVLETSPLIQDTDGDGILDCDEKNQQEYVYETPKDDVSIEEVKVIMNATGNIENTTCIEGMRGMDPLCEGVAGLVDEPFSIETESDFDTAIISFKMNMDSLENKSVEDFIILWYDEENQKFVEMETTYDVSNSTISTETTHFSRYMVVDSATWFAAWNMELNYVNTEYEKSNCYTVLAVDCSGSMDTYDPITYGFDTSNKVYVNNCHRYKAVLNYVQAMQEEDKTAIVAFDDNAYTLCELTDDKVKLSTAARGFFNDGGTEYNIVLQEALNILNNSTGGLRKKIVLLSDGVAYADVNILNDIKDANIKVYTIGLGSSSYDSELKRIADETGGEFFKAYTSDELTGIYEDIGLTEEMDATDMDEDGLYDIYETIGMQLQNGTVIYTDPTKPDSDGDGLLDGVEMNTEMQHKEVYYPTDVPLVADYFIMYSNPNMEDTDGDGYSDYEEVKVHMSNPLVSNLRIGQISNDYIAIDTPDDIDDPNYYYGGSQMWFYDVNNPDRNDSVSRQIQGGGCGIIASCDNILYLQKHMGWNLTTVDTTGEMIAFDEYDEFVRGYAENYHMPSNVNLWCKTAFRVMGVLPHPYGVSPLYYQQIDALGYSFSMVITGGDGTSGIPTYWLELAINNYLCNNEYSDHQYKKYDTRSCGKEEIEKKIALSLDRNIPVIFLTNQDSQVRCQYEDKGESGVLGAHFITITGISMDTITGETILIISTWSHKATVSLDEFYNESATGSRTVIME